MKDRTNISREKAETTSIPYAPSASDEMWVIRRDFDTVAVISPEFDEETVEKIAELLNKGAREFERNRGMSFEG